MERKHRHIVETSLALLAHSSLLVHFWDEAFLAMCYLINRLPSRTIQNSTPMELLFHETPDYAFLHAFGYVWWPNLHPYNNHKLAFRSTQCVFLGYSSVHKGYKCLDRSTGRIYISRDVMFDEHLFPFASAPSASTNPSSPTTIPDHELVAYNDHMRHYKLELLATDNPAECGSLPLLGSGSSGGPATPGVTLHSLDVASVASATIDVPTPAVVPPTPAGSPASSVVPAGSPASTRSH
jgi:hypothetical protein